MFLFSARYQTSRNSRQMNKYLFVYMLHLMCLPNIEVVHIWENQNTAALLQCLLEFFQPQLSLNFFRFGTRCWQLKSGLIIRLSLIVDIWLLIFDSLLTVTIYQACTFCVLVPSVKLLSVAEPYASFLEEVPLVWLFGVFLNVISFVMWSIPFLIN